MKYIQDNNNSWLDGNYDDIDFRKELNDIGNYGLEKPIGNEHLD